MPERIVLRDALSERKSEDLTDDWYSSMTLEVLFICKISENRRSLTLVFEDPSSEPIMSIIIKATTPIIPIQKNLEDRSLFLVFTATGRLAADISLRYSCLSIYL